MAELVRDKKRILIGFQLRGLRFLPLTAKMDCLKIFSANVLLFKFIAPNRQLLLLS